MSETISKSKFARLPPFRTMSDEEMAVVSKLVKPNAVGATRGAKRAMDIPDISVLGKIASSTATSNNDAKNLFQVLPDMDLARSILVSAILSPTDMVSTTLHYTLEANSLDDNLTGPMLRIIRDFFDVTYKIKKFLPEMLSDALFMKGAYPLLVMPETSIDHSINSAGAGVTLESIKDEVTADGWYRPYGALGVPNNEGIYSPSLEGLWSYSRPSLESLTKDKFSVFKGFSRENSSEKVALGGTVYVTDNPSVLSNPRLLEILRKKRQTEIYGARNRNVRNFTRETTSLEGQNSVKVKTNMTLDATEKLFYVNRQRNATPMQMMLTPKQLESKNKANPLVMHLPTECVIPVHVPGNVREHIGYFVLLDINGNPLTINYHDDYYADIRASMNGDANMSSQLISMARRNSVGSSSAWGDGEIDYMQRAYQQAVENDLLNRLRTGAITGEYELANCQEVFRMMFARSLAAKNTMLLYVPAEFMTYITFDYNDYGVGKSLLEDGKILGSLRAVLLFASTMSAVKNSVDGRNINITLPEEDENPYETVTFMLGEYAKVNRSGFPIGETHPMELITHLQNAGTVVTVQGNTAFPEAKLEIESRDNGHKTVDRDFDEELRRRHIQTFGLTPETMEASTGADFATTVVNQHLMLLKRVIQYQEEFRPFLNDFVRRYTLNSGPLFDDLLEVVEANKKYLPAEYKDQPEEFVISFINLIDIELPSPETNRLEDQMRGYDTYTTAVTSAIDAYLKSESLDPIASQGLEEHLDAIKATIISMLQRRYLREKNILPELDIFNTLTEDEGPAFDLLSDAQVHYDGVLSTIEGYMKKMVKEATKRKKRLEKEQAEQDALTGGGDAGGFGGDDMGGDDTGGMDDTGGDDDMGGGDDGLDGMDDMGNPDESGGDDGLDALDESGDTDAEPQEASDEPAESTEPAETAETTDVEKTDTDVEEPPEEPTADTSAGSTDELETNDQEEETTSETEEPEVEEEEEEPELELPEAPPEDFDDDEHLGEIEVPDVEEEEEGDDLKDLDLPDLEEEEGDKKPKDKK